MLGLASTAQALTFTFQAGAATPVVGGIYAGAEDVMILTNLGGDTQTNYGLRTNMELGEAPAAHNGTGFLRHDLIRFDVTALSGLGALNVTSITLRLTVSDFGALAPGQDVAGTDIVQLYEMTPANASWTEPGARWRGGWVGSDGASTLSVRPQLIITVPEPGIAGLIGASLIPFVLRVRSHRIARC